jgi:DNA-binding HxlR family transcriptional regulator
MADDVRAGAAHDVPPCGCATPGFEDAATCYCGVEDLLRIIRRRYSLAVMNVIHRHTAARYHDVAAALPTISSATLSETLHALDAASLVRRTRPSDDASFMVYELTASGSKLLSRLRLLLTDLEAE